MDGSIRPAGSRSCRAGTIAAVTNVVTGVFSFTGGAIARRLLDAGESVTTLSRRPEPDHALAPRVTFERLQFDDREALVASLRGARVLYNTYWIRFPRGAVTWETVLANTRTLLEAARAAGVERVVQLSVSNASEDSPFGYFRAKALAERELRESGLAHAIVRPTLVFGPGDLLVNDIAWVLRRFRLFPVPSDAGYPIQPVSLEDAAELAVTATDGSCVDAAGPDVLPFERLVRLVRAAVGSRAPVVRTPRAVSLALAGVVGRALRDVLVTPTELDAIRAGLLVSHNEPTGAARFEDWLTRDAHLLGRSFVSERRRNWT
jgi:NADH dehydrogenase